MATDPTKHDMSVDRSTAHVSEKIYLMPESFNALRRELSEHWPNMWNSPLQYCMAFDGPRFVQLMDSALDTVTQFDSGDVDGMCKKFLDELRVKRGLSRLHNPSEYHNNNAMEQEVRLARAANEVAPWKLPPTGAGEKK